MNEARQALIMLVWAGIAFIAGWAFAYERLEDQICDDLCFDHGYEGGRMLLDVCTCTVSVTEAFSPELP